MFQATASAAEIAAKNSELYDETTGPIWELAVYGPLHDGWEFINLGGHRLLDLLVERSGLGPGAAVAELCCGQGATCRLLAERQGWRVTGVEMNPRQVERAREGLAGLDPEVAARIEIVEADALAWQPADPFAAVFSLDSLMLIPDPEAFLVAARRALAPEGFLLASTLAAGPEIDDRLRRFVWEVDGMITVRSPDELRELARSTGFPDAAVDDLTPLAVEASERILEGLEGAREEIVRREGEDGYRGWYEGGEVYLDAFRDGRLAYALLTGRRGG